MNRLFSRFSAVTALGFAVAGLTASPALACSGCGCMASPPPPKAPESAAPSGDIVETAVSAGKFGTLLAAAEAAGLVETLKSEGPLTLFAPTDDAFAKLPEGTVASLLEPENKDQLVAVLTFHVVPGKVMAKDALKAGEAASVQGGTLTFTVEDHGDHQHAKVNGVEIIATDIETTNGVIHVVEEVLLPGE
ncbi:MAG: fasciclin domain-containing protein [Planctomycetota bacterium]